MRYRTLIAEDNSTDVTLVREAVHAPNLHFEHVASDGTVAIALIRQFDADSRDPLPGLAMIDMHLPKRDAEEIPQCLRTTHSYAQVAVMVMTSFDSLLIEDIATNAGLSYFRRPSNLDEFFELGQIARRNLSKASPNGGRQISSLPRGRHDGSR